MNLHALYRPIGPIGSALSSQDPFGQYGMAKYDPLAKAPMSDSFMDKAAGRLFDSHSPGAYGAYYGAAASDDVIQSRRERGGRLGAADLGRYTYYIGNIDYR